MKKIIKNNEILKLTFVFLTVIFSVFLIAELSKKILVDAESDCVSTAAVACTQTTDGDYKINKYTLVNPSVGASTTWTPPTGVNSVEYLVVGGGGGGGTNPSTGGGGGGAGGFRTGIMSLSTGSEAITVTVGAGGAPSTNGGSSEFFSIISAGGGTSKSDGGSGGGCTGYEGSVPGKGNIPSVSPSQGNDGGLQYNDRHSGGGGGAGFKGVDGASGKAGNGGDGLSSSITGTATMYAGGGGAGNDGYYGGDYGRGGSGGGGNGSTAYPNAGSPGTDGLGGGGGGGNYYSTAGGRGGSGVVIIRYTTSTSDCLSTSKVACTQTTDGFYNVNTYTLVNPLVGASTNWTAPTGVTSVEYLIIGGGGGGGAAGLGAGGGGAGEFLNSTDSVTANTTYKLTIGAGGAGMSSRTGYTSGVGGTGGSSSFIGKTVAGGGGGSAGNVSGGSGGSGGGGNGGYYTSGGSSVTSGGGNGTAGGASSSTPVGSAGGGGGAGVAGDAASSSTWNGNAYGYWSGKGGNGKASSITGTAKYYAGGGGGGTGYTEYTTSTPTYNYYYAGVGGAGGGGLGGYGPGANGTNGKNNTGSGGGGGGGLSTASKGGDGGSGVVIIRYLDPTKVDCGSTSAIECVQTTDGLYKVNTYTLVDPTTSASTTWGVPGGVSQIEYLVVGGGGGGANDTAGGGGAGGLISNYGLTKLSVSGSLTVTVGAGGASGVAPASGSGFNSIISGSGFEDIKAIGGGSGGINSSPVAYLAQVGGSGGGGARAASGASGTDSQGYAGGSGINGNSYPSGGGGGAGGPGGSGVAPSTSGNGGLGLSNSITGKAVMYAGGGGGGMYVVYNSTAYSGFGGSGIGGDGAMWFSNYAGNGMNNTGSGGGGANYASAGGLGGSGIVIIRYLIPVSINIYEVTPVSTPTTDTTPSYTFNSSAAGTITYGGSCSSATTTAVAGNNTIVFNTLAIGTYSDCTIKVTDSSSTDSNVLTVSSFTIKSTDNSCWYCDYYYNDGVLTTGKDGQLDFKFTYSNSSSATLTGYRVAISPTNLSLANIDSQAEVINPSSSAWLSGGSAASGTEITYTGTSVKLSPSASLFQIGYGTGSAVKSYYWWVKLKDSNGVESAWIPSGTAFNTPKRHYPVVRVASGAVAANNPSQFCAGADITNSEDPCYSICWKGTGSPVVSLTNTNWKCSVCFDSTNSPVSCTNTTLIAEGKTLFNWRIPSTYVSGTDYAYQSPTTNTSANPIITFNRVISDLNMGLSITGSECGAQSEMSVINLSPDWREISPF